MFKKPKNKEEINKVFDKERCFTKKRLGRYIDLLFPNSDKKYATSSGCIKNKIDFCKSVISIVNDFEQLSEEAKLLTEKIYKFIEKNNN